MLNAFRVGEFIKALYNVGHLGSGLVYMYRPSVSLLFSLLYPSRGRSIYKNSTGI
jgi:hypothetical protein